MGIFMLFGSSELQPWAQGKPTAKKEISEVVLNNRNDELSVDLSAQKRIMSENGTLIKNQIS